MGCLIEAGWGFLKREAATFVVFGEAAYLPIFGREFTGGAGSIPKGRVAFSLSKEYFFGDGRDAALAYVDLTIFSSFI